ncbi:AbrB family transcriptional regulator [Telmatospirillum sp. J64-1]|uniref:AbrB family transcriptional regulator n=1 Tax=Telmatospirillum sp. J64-1 TaxID=2502183 RepID=UPI00163DB6C4|nr:AbrB family transcriptional regulator [Telmatospirillum sp. J64-1]
MLVFSLIGGLVFALAGLPAPWLLGPLAATVAVSLSGIRQAFPTWMQTGVLLMIGINVGGALTPESLAQAANWLPSILGMMAALFGSLVIGAVFLTRVGHFTGDTAFFAAFPGHLAMVLATAAESRAAMGSVATAQSLRLTMLVVAIPTLLYITTPGGGVVERSLPDPLSVAVAMTAGIAGWLLARRFNLPAPPLMGTILGSGAASLAGFSIGPLPEIVEAGLLLAVGGMIGARFYGSSARLLAAALPVCLASVLLALLTTAAIALPLSHVTGLPFGQLLMAYAPGGADVMPLLAMSLGYDPAFVGVHHSVRLVVTALALPLLARRYLQ